MNRTGTVYVVSAPSGAGKTSLIRAFMLKKSSSNYWVSVSHTTREPRTEEIHGQDYFFVTKKSFKKIILEDGFIEYSEVFNKYYGTSKHVLFDVILAGKNVILDIDWQGKRQIKTIFPKCISIFIMPPSTKVLYQRLIQRGKDSPEVIKKRMVQAEKEISYVTEYDHIVVNNDFKTALKDVSTIFRAEFLKIEPTFTC